MGTEYMAKEFSRWAALLGCLGTSALAQDVVEASFVFQGRTLNIEQAPRADMARLAQVSLQTQDCDGICIAPLTSAEGVDTIAEFELIRFLEDSVASGDGLLIDTRPLDGRDAGAISASISVPAELLEANNPFRKDILVAMGARELDGALNFADAMPLMIYDNGPLENDAARSVSLLVEAGYPANKIKYYRGGIQVWTALGLSVEETTS